MTRFVCQSHTATNIIVSDTAAKAHALNVTIIAEMYGL
jgi:hypothetical protein